MCTGIHGSNSWATLETSTLTYASSLATHNSLRLAVDRLIASVEAAAHTILMRSIGHVVMNNEALVSCKNFKSENRLYINDWNNELK